MGMRLTHESRPLKWTILIATWFVCAVLILLHTSAVREYVGILNDLGRRGDGLPPTPFQQVIPARHADAQMWVRHVLTAGENGQARVRFTNADNAPTGREVHWSSAFGWLLRGAAAIETALSGKTGAAALERTLLWFNAPLLLVLIVLLSAWVARRAGAGAGVLIALGLIGHHRLFEGFAPTYVDHHGLATTTVLGLLVGIVFMGFGWTKPASPAEPPLLPPSPKDARSAAVFSALCGAMGLWISAATALPVIALCGAGALVMNLAFGRSLVQSQARFAPEIWRVWGRVGAAASFVFYLIEYAPSHFSLRLEVNHPLYSLGWWGGAELVAALSASRLHGGRRLNPVLLVLFLLAISAAPLAILFGGTATFAIGDPFVGALRHFVAEGMSLPAALQQFGLRRIAPDLASAAVLVPAVVVLWRQPHHRGSLLGVMTLLTVVLIAMAFFEMRWWLNAAAAQLALLVTLLAATGIGSARRRWLGLTAIACVLFLVPAVYRVGSTRAENRARAVAAGDLLQPLYRDIAATLRESQPDGEIILLANPNASSGIGYFGRFQTLGTLYWENARGLRAAAEIFSAPTDEAAFSLLRARRVTHVVLLANANFLGEYHRLLHPQSSPADARSTFGYRLLSRESTARWLQPIPFRRPPELEAASDTVQLFKVTPEQTEVERLYFTGLAQVAEGRLDVAEKTIESAIGQAAARERPSIYEAAGSAVYDYGADALAVRLFRRAPDFERNPNLVNTTAWILATSRDDRLRDGRTALALVEPLASANASDPTVLSTFAAACAEVGRFPDAIRAAERAVALIRTSGDRAAESLLQRRLDSYRANRPWRQ